ncbi:MAG TPA: peptidylprolyl isomerase [Methylococcaceae bacterium]|nr:peptidylprolyl isomerase [Methylococcaceae bacterium]
MSRDTRLMWRIFAALLILGAPLSQGGESSGDRIVAVVEDGVILESELNGRIASIVHKLRESNTPEPPEFVLRRQVLDRLVLEKLQIQMAERGGIRVDDETLRQAVQQIAARNKMSLEEFRQALEEDGGGYARFSEQIRGEILISRLRAAQVNNRIKISDREIDNFLATENLPSGGGQNSEFRLGHILVATPPGASSEQVRKAGDKAERLVAELKGGADFRQTAISESNDSYALSGGDLGWRSAAALPSLFAELVPGMKEGEIAGPIRSSSGFHIVKLLEARGGGKASTTKTHVRHILLKTSEVLDDADARERLLALRQRVEGGEDFSSLARAHSDDKGSAIKGGDLGFVERGALVPAFEEAMDKLKDGEIGDPVQTQFGWHLIQVLGRERREDAQDMKRAQAREALFRRKAEEETELWLRQMRDEAYVEIRLDEKSD